jgi:hypothetical protein
MVDWDEDGDTDLLVGEYDGHVHYFQNIGTPTVPELRDMGHLQAGGIDIDVSQLAIPVVNDWNEDGMKDLVIGNDNANIRVYLNTGTNEDPAFSDFFYLSCTPGVTQIKNAPDIGDLNGDGLKDLVFGWWQGTVVYYPNSGTNASPVFESDYELTALGTIIDPGGWTHLELNDWDEDGDLDLVYGEWNGEVYIHLNVTNELEAVLTPYGTPIQIPASGGSFDWNGALTNNSSNNITATVWTAAKLPNGSETGALLQVTLTMSSGNQIDRDRTQMVPEAAPAGQYEYFLRWGSYPDQAWAESSFEFEKLADGDGSSGVQGWACTGEPFETVEPAAAATDFVLFGAYPNPFNPETTLRFGLPQACEVSLNVYDISGRLLMTLVDGWRDAGMHGVTLDGSNLVSGVYLYRLDAGDFNASGKLVLMK